MIKRTVTSFRFHFHSLRQYASHENMSLSGSLRIFAIVSQTSNQLTMINCENSCSPRQCCTSPDSKNHHEMRLEAARIKLQRRLLTSDFEISCVVASSTPQMYSRRAQTCPTHQRSWLFSFRYIKGVLKMQIGRLDHLIAILF